MTRALGRGLGEHPEPALERALEVRVAHRLADVVVHAGGEAALAVAVHRVRGHRDHGRVAAAALAAAQLGGRLVAVELGIWQSISTAS